MHEPAKSRSATSPQENLQERPDLRKQASRKYHDYEGSIEADGMISAVRKDAGRKHE